MVPDWGDKVDFLDVYAHNVTGTRQPLMCVVFFLFFQIIEIYSVFSSLERKAAPAIMMLFYVISFADESTAAKYV